MPRRVARRTSRYGNTEPLTEEARRALPRLMKAAVRKANDNIHKVLKPTYFQHIPLGDVYDATERTGLAIPEDEKSCMLTGRIGRAMWPLTFHGLRVPQHLWITWHKMDTTGRYEVIGAIT
jgi:hypothetical protein